MPPKFFQIGFNKCGTTFIARIFEMNGIPTAHWLEGALAEDIAWSRLTDARPLARWSDRITAFTDMESVRFLNMPVIEGFRHFDLLDAHYPDAVFMLNTRRLEDWIVSRYRHRGGAYARAHAAIRGVALGDLADLWAEDWATHLDAVRRHFAGRHEFIEIDIDEATPEDYRRALSPWFDLPRMPDLPGAGVRLARKSNLDRLSTMLAMPAPGLHLARTGRARLAAWLGRLALPVTLDPAPVTRPPNGDAVRLDLDRGELFGADGARLPLRRRDDGWFYLAPDRPGLLRVATIANDIAQLTRHGCFWIDMRPAGPRQPVQAPVIGCLRRKGARNVVLWPAPWLHRIGNSGFPDGTPPRGPGFADLPERLTWRGDLSADLAQAVARSRMTPTPESGQPARFGLCPARPGGDTDFLPLLQHAALILKEEGPTEGFASALFRPWRHYVPLAPSGADFGAKLEWARANPVRAGQIASRAHRLAARLGDPAGRRAHLRHVLDRYLEATGQAALPPCAPG